MTPDSISISLWRVLLPKELRDCVIVEHSSNGGVVHNCQHLPISTESTNLGGGRG